MKIEMPHSGIWKIHLALAALLCSWLIATEYLISVSFSVKLLVVVALVVMTSLLTRLRFNDLREHLTEEVLKASRNAALTYAQFKRVIEMQSTLRYMFGQLHPDYDRSAISDHLYSRWLWCAITKGNILSWLSSYVETAGTKLPRLTWVLDHFPLHERAATEQILNYNVLAFRGDQSMMIEEFHETRPRAAAPKIVPQVRPDHTSAGGTPVRHKEEVLV